MRTKGDQNGFTLLEILVVLLIVGIMMGMAVLSVGPGDREKGTRDELARLKGVLDLVSREAVLDAREWGIRFSDHGYLFLVLDDKNQWRSPPAGDRTLQPRRLPETMPMVLRIEGVPLDKLEVKPEDPPQVMVSSDGEMTPFELELTVPGDARTGEKVAFRLSAGLTGRTRIERVAVTP
ncbi:MAG: type II secretion system minor pseudopilin GspH [Magnetococcales bacterium]|nr:type II secretion system minor pseudopilin GspH [Magnetococcales bacterium]